MTQLANLDLPRPADNDTGPGGVRFLWLDLTRRCQLACPACYNDSGPSGTHGSMTRQDWCDVLDQAAAAGIARVQFIGGEVTLHPDAPGLVAYALDLGLDVEVYSNLVHVTDVWWRLLRRNGASLATSYYSDVAAEHNAMTGRPSHRATLANIDKAVALGIHVRVGIVAGLPGQRTEHARDELADRGVNDIRIDRVRPYGRAAGDAPPDVSGLCGRCGGGRAAIGPDGRVSPCVFATWMSAGDVREQDLVTILTGEPMRRATTTIRRTPRTITACDPDGDCTPGYPDSGCSPRN